MINIITEVITSCLLLILLFLAFQGKHLLRHIGSRGPGLAILGLVFVFATDLGEMLMYVADYFQVLALDPQLIFSSLKLLESTGLTMIIIGGLLWLPDAKKIVRSSYRLTHQNQALAQAVSQSASDLEESRMALEDERLLFLSGPMFSCQWQPHDKWRTVYASSNVFSILGYSCEELTDSQFNFVTLLHPKDVDKFLSMGKKVLQPGENFIEFDCRIRSKYDRYRWLQILFRTDRRQTGGIIGYMLDITRQKDAENEKERHFRRWKFALETGREGLWDWNIKTGEVELAKGWQAMLGFSDEQLPRNINAFRQLIHPDDLDAVRNEINLHLQDHTHFYSCEHRVKNAAGDYIWVSAQGKIMDWNEDGTPFHMVGKQIDISTIRQMKNEVDEANSKMLQAYTSRTSFVQSLSLEMRPKLNNALGITESLEQSMRSTQQRQQTQQIKSALFSLMETVNDITRFNQLKSGTMTADTIDFNLLELCESKITELYPICRSKNIELSLQSHLGHHRWYRGAQQFIANLLDHLLSNAIKFTSSGEVHLVVSPGKGASSDRVYLQILDTGTGIPPQYRAQLEPSYRAKEQELLIGKGLGLAIVTELVNRLSGELLIEQSNDQGTTLRLDLHLEKASKKRLPTQPAAQRVQSLSEDIFHIISPCVHMRQALASMLRNHEATTFCHEGSRGCLSLLKTSTYSSKHSLTLILDQNLANKEGLQLTDIELTNVGVDRVILISHPQPSHTQTPHSQLPGNYFQHGGSDINPAMLENIDFILHKPVTPKSVEALYQELAGTLIPTAFTLQKPRSPQAVASNSTKKRVLVAEDIVANQIVAEGMLLKFGIQPIIAENGQVAVNLHQADPFDLILMDCHMPLMDGFKATESIREMESLRCQSRAPIIAVTAGNQTDQRRLCKRAGMDDVLFKPYSLEQIAYILESRLGIDTAPIVAELMETQPTEPRTEPASTGRTMSSPDVAAGSIEATPVFDEKAFTLLHKTLKHDRMSILVAAFLRECQSLLSQLPGALNAEQFDEARRLVHSIKSSSASLGALKLSLLAKNSETAALEGNLGFIKDHLPQLQQYFEAAAHMIKQQLQNASDS